MPYRSLIEALYTLNSLPVVSFNRRRLGKSSQSLAVGRHWRSGGADAREGSMSIVSKYPRVYPQP